MHIDCYKWINFSMCILYEAAIPFLSKYAHWRIMYLAHVAIIGIKCLSRVEGVVHL